ncbi:hypothetical protein Hanom_Chr10g00891451 [Helianthus anomalus]
MGYGGVWVGLGFGLGHLLTYGMGAPHHSNPRPWGMVGLGLGGHEFALDIESLPCHLLARPTPQPKPTRWWLGRFQPTHALTQAPYPIALNTLSLLCERVRRGCHLNPLGMAHGVRDIGRYCSCIENINTEFIEI